jgi:hypothetical protein
MLRQLQRKLFDLQIKNVCSDKVKVAVDVLRLEEKFWILLVQIGSVNDRQRSKPNHFQQNFRL